MKTLFLMVMLSQNGAGDINASFVNTDTLDACQVKQQVVQGIFSSAGIPILENRCIESELKFTPFQHSTSSKTPRQFYLIDYGSQSITIEQVPDWRQCMQQQRRDGENRVYCASSIQVMDR